MNSYVAFISYSHKDKGWAKWLHQRLEWYRLPSHIRNDVSGSSFVRPVFRDQDELNSGILEDELHNKLDASKYLIVICSHNSCNSAAVRDEVEYFLRKGWADKIIPFVVEGKGREFFPAVLKDPEILEKYGCPLGIAAFEDGHMQKNKALVRIVSRLFGVPFDSLWRRHRRRIVWMSTEMGAILLSFLVLFCLFALPVNLTIDLSREESSLPSNSTGTLLINGESYTIDAEGTPVVVSGLPGFYRFTKLPYTVKMNRYYIPECGEFSLSWRLAQSFSVFLHRDDAFSTFAGTVKNTDGLPVIGASVHVGDKCSKTDSSGRFEIVFPLSQQTPTKDILICKDGFLSFNREDEVPGRELAYILEK